MRSLKKSLLIKLTIILSLLSVNIALAFSLDGAIDNLKDSAKESIKPSQGKDKKPLNLDNIANSIGDDVKKEAYKAIEDFKDKLDSEQKRITSDVTKTIEEVKAMKTDAESFITDAKNIQNTIFKYIDKDLIAKFLSYKDKIFYYIDRADTILLMAKLFIAFLSCSSLVIVFLIWRGYRRINNLYKFVDNVRNLKDFEKRLVALETAKQ